MFKEIIVRTLTNKNIVNHTYRRLVSNSTFNLNARSYGIQANLQKFNNLTITPRRQFLIMEPLVKLENARSYASKNENFNANEGRFTLDIKEVGCASLEFELENNFFTIKHTLVPKEMGGKGVGKVLAKAALDYAISNGYALKIECGFVQHYVQKCGDKYAKYIQ